MLAMFDVMYTHQAGSTSARHAGLMS